jgi:anti-anti-sigma factor
MTMHDLQVIVRGSDGTAVIELAGDIDSRADAAFDRAFEQAVALDARTLTLDFAKTVYVNSTGIAVIVGLLAQARARAIPVRATGLSEHYREIFEITRLVDFMTIIDHEEPLR